MSVIAVMGNGQVMWVKKLTTEQLHSANFVVEVDPKGTHHITRKDRFHEHGETLTNDEMLTRVQEYVDFVYHGCR
jgi:hypothetical protein